MKWITIILSIYLVGLSIMPCADMEKNNPASITAQFSSDDDHSHDAANDLCSPFCVCNCCGVQVLSFHPNVLFEFPVKLSSASLALPNYKSIFVSHFFKTIWQPPQIV